MVRAIGKGMKRNHKGAKTMRDYNTLEIAGMVVMYGFSFLVLAGLLAGYIAILVNAVRTAT